MRHDNDDGRRRLFGLALWASVLVFSAGCQDLWREVGSRDWGQQPAADGGSAHPAGPRTPRAKHECPELKAGEVELAGTKVRLWIGDQQKPGGSLVVYWYATGSSPLELTTGAGPNLAALLADNAVVATLTTTTGEGVDTSTGTWYTGDLAVVDELVACAVDQLGIDVRRIYTSGCSSGAVQAGVMAYLRSSYVAAASLNSGGLVTQFALEDSSHVPAVITAHGPQGLDVIIIDFADASVALDRDVVKRGGFAVDCAHEGGHCGATPELKAVQWQFLQAHTFGIDPEPYADGLPQEFPAACTIIED